MRSRVYVLALTGCVLMAVAGCRREYEVIPPAPPPVQSNEEHERLVAAQRSQYEELQGQLASMKLRIEDEIRLYELALDEQDPLNRREDPIALAGIVDATRALHEKSAAALAVDSEVFKYVKGSARTLRDYTKFADATLAEYEPRQTTASSVEASMFPEYAESGGATSADSDLP